MRQNRNIAEAYRYVQKWQDLATTEQKVILQNKTGKTKQSAFKNERKNLVMYIYSIFRPVLDPVYARQTIIKPFINC